MTNLNILLLIFLTQHLNICLSELSCKKCLLVMPCCESSLPDQYHNYIENSLIEHCYRNLCERDHCIIDDKNGCKFNILWYKYKFNEYRKAKQEI